MDGSGYLLGAFSPQANMTVKVPDSNKYFEPDLQASTSLLLHSREGCPQEKVSDLRCLHGQEEERDLLQGPDLNVLDLGKH